MNNQLYGKQGEAHVATYLKQQGFFIVDQNYRKFFGEIDIIARKENLYIFVEVKTRKSNRIPLGSLIAPSKQKKIIATAESYIAQHQLTDAIFRFDVALLQLDKATYKLEYVENAFVKKEDNTYGQTNFY